MAGLRRPHNWLQLFKFLLVGGSGYVLNLITFAVLVQVLDVHHLIGATVAFLVGITNNFWWNRHWTFGAGDGQVAFQAARFIAVSSVAFVVQIVLLEVLVSGFHVPKVLAQAISVVAATPVNFVGNKMWSFRRSAPRA